MRNKAKIKRVVYITFFFIILFAVIFAFALVGSFKNMETDSRIPDANEKQEVDERALDERVVSESGAASGNSEASGSGEVSGGGAASGNSVILGNETVSDNGSVSDDFLPEEQPDSEVETDGSVSILMVGDILLHDRVEESCRNELGEYDFKPIFAPLRDTINSYDIAIVNEEVIIGGEELGISGYPAFNGPYEVADALVDAGFDVICHGTNHALDKGKRGIINSLANWEKYEDIDVIGIYDSKESADSVLIKECNGIKVAVLNYTYGTNGISLPGDMPFAVNLLEESSVVDDIRYAEENADFTIVCPHWGTEYNLGTDGFQEKWTDIFLQNGVDLVIGTHPHVLEPYEMISSQEGDRQMLVYYSLGNYVNWTSGTGSGTGNRMVGGMAEVEIEKKGDEVAIADYRLEPIVCHLAEGYGGVVTYPLDEYSKEMADRNLIRLQDPEFDYDYILNLCEKIGIQVSE